MSLFEHVSQIRDNNSITQNEIGSTSKKLQIATQLKELKPGQTFSGEVVGIDGNEVQLKLSDKSIITAKLEGKINVSMGQVIQFQVKTNSESLLEIKPIISDALMDKNVLKALFAANIPINDTTKALVNALMDEGMPINKSTLQQLYKQVLSNKDSNLSSIVQLNRLQIPVTLENLQQFEAYKNYQHQIIKGVEKIVDEIPIIFYELSTEGKKEEGNLFYTKILDIISKSTSSEKGRNELTSLLKDQTIPVNEKNPENMDSIKHEMNQGKGLQTKDIEFIKNQIIQEKSLTPEILTLLKNGSNQGQVGPIEILDLLKSQITQGKGNDTELIDLLKSQMTQEQGKSQGILDLIKLIQTKESDVFLPNSPLTELDQRQIHIAQPKFMANQIGSMFTTDEIQSLHQLLEPIQLLEETMTQIKNGNITNKELLTQLQNTVMTLPKLEFQQVFHDIFSSEEFSKLVTKEMMQQWTLEPIEVGQNKNVEELYTRINAQTKQMIELLSSVGKEDTTMMKATTNLQNNLDFMNQLNQVLSYVQLPIKRGESNAHGELYVYSNKKNLATKEGKVSALLHLDMDNLGKIEIYVEMENGKVDSKFYLEKENLLDFVESNSHLLINKLEKRGYNMSMEVLKKEKPETMIEQIIEDEKPNQLISKTAFDMRA